MGGQKNERIILSCEFELEYLSTNNPLKSSSAFLGTLVPQLACTSSVFPYIVRLIASQTTSVSYDAGTESAKEGSGFVGVVLIPIQNDSNRI